MQVSDFHFDLPEELIAQHPPAQRGASRMLVMARDRGAANSTVQGAAGNGEEPAGNKANDLAGWSLRDAWFRELPDLLRAGDLLVLNDSRVIPARLFARRASHPSEAQMGRQKANAPSGKIEVLLTERIIESTVPSRQSLDGAPNTNGADAMEAPYLTSLRDVGQSIPSANVWRALVKPGRKVRVGERLEFFAEDGQLALSAEVIASGERGERTLRFTPAGNSNSDVDFHAALARIGHMPLPPYIRHGSDEPADRERYQTVYARQAGSAAAPTAGLHFTPEMLEQLRARGVEIAYITLHVGLGTFQPVRVERVEDVQLHAERYTLPAETADALRRALREGRRIVAVGTTTTRTLEHVAREAGADFTTPPRQSLGGAPNSSWIERIGSHSGETSIFIAPGHRFRMVSGLLTNFHLPESTLLMLVSAFAADRMAPGSRTTAFDWDAGRRAVLAAYGHAVREGYRFYSYGDCMLVL